MKSDSFVRAAKIDELRGAGRSQRPRTAWTSSWCRPAPGGARFKAAVLIRARC